MNLYEIKYTITFNGEEDDASGIFLKAASKELAILKFRRRHPKSEVICNYLVEIRIDCIIEYKKVEVYTNPTHS